jgi:hypothetical protein
MSSLLRRLFRRRGFDGVDWDDAGETLPQVDERIEVADRVIECLQQLGISSHEVGVSTWIRRGGAAVVLVDVKPNYTTLWSYGPHIEYFIASRLKRKYSMRIASVRIQRDRESAFAWVRPQLGAEALYRALRSLDHNHVRVPDDSQTLATHPPAYFDASELSPTQVGQLPANSSQARLGA